MTPIHQNNYEQNCIFISDLKVFRLEMRHVRLSNLFHSVGAAKDLSKQVLDQFLLSECMFASVYI